MELKCNLSTAAGVTRLQKALDDLQARCSVRTVTADQVVKAAADVCKTLDIPRKALAGCTFTLDLNAQDFAKAYKYYPESTHVAITCNGRTWYAVSVSRCGCRPWGHDCTADHLTDAAKQAILDKYACFSLPY